MSAVFSLRPTYLSALAMPPRVAGILRRLGEHKGRQELYRRQAPEMLENLRRIALIESTESSNRLEGIVAANEKRLRALVNQRSTPENRTEGEIAGYRMSSTPSTRITPTSRFLIEWFSSSTATC